MSTDTRYEIMSVVKTTNYILLIMNILFIPMILLIKLLYKFIQVYISVLTVLANMILGSLLN